MRLLCFGTPVQPPICVEQCTPKWLRGACRMSIRRGAPVLASLSPPDNHIDGHLTFVFDADAEAPPLPIPYEHTEFALSVLADMYAASFDPPSDTDWDPPPDDDDAAAA
jgi:hypothetical protein